MEYLKILMTCIFCDSDKNITTIEHIVPESLGNLTYVLDKDGICKSCNNKFAKFEQAALSNTIIGFERTRFSILTKKGKLPRSEVKRVVFTADKQMRKNTIEFSGVTQDEITNFDSQTGSFQMKVSAFDKNEVLVSKFLLKIGIESLYKSNKKIFKKYNFTELKDFITAKENIDWPFITTQKEFNLFKSIPRYTDKHSLKRINCQLLFSELNQNTLLFRFIYGGFKANINLLNKNVVWIEPYLVKFKNVLGIHQNHFKNKLDCNIL